MENSSHNGKIRVLARKIHCKYDLLIGGFHSILLVYIYILVNNNKFTYDKLKTVKFGFNLFDIFCQV